MSRQAEANPNQMVLRCSAELVPEANYENLDPEARMSLRTLVGMVLETVPAGKEPITDDYFHAEPGFIAGGLYIHPTHSRYDQAQHAIRLGVPRNATSIRNLGDLAVVFPVTEYATVARNPRDLGRHTVARTAKAQLSEPSQEKASKTSMRSAGHTLIGKIHAQGRLLSKLESQRTDFIALHRDLRSPFRTRYKAKNLEKMRARTDEAIHETIEVASVFLEFDDKELSGVHRATRRNLYNGNYSSSQFDYNWLRYITMVGRHNGAKVHKLQISRELCREELKEYQPYLDAKRDEQAQAA